MIFDEKIGQTPAKFDNMIDNIFKVVFGMNVHKGNKFLLATYDPTQLQPIRGSQFLVPPRVIPCCKNMLIKNSVCAQDDNVCRVQRIFRNSYEELIDNSHITDEFERLCKGFTFVGSWDDPKIIL